jgi:DNA-binding CsgD family transcriptional regulator
VSVRLLWRRRLIDAVGRRPITVITAPHGAGKSVLLQQIADAGAAADGATDGLLLIDDAHQLAADTWLALAEQQITAGSSIVFAARSAPTALLQTWRLRALLVELTFQQLCFDADELQLLAGADAPRLAAICAGWPAVVQSLAALLPSGGDADALGNAWAAQLADVLPPQANAVCRDLAPYTQLTRAGLMAVCGLPPGAVGTDQLGWLGVPLVRSGAGWALPPFLRGPYLTAAAADPPAQQRRRALTVLRTVLKEPGAVAHWPWPTAAPVATSGVWFTGLRNLPCDRLPTPAVAATSDVDTALAIGAYGFTAFARGDFATAADQLGQAAAALGSDPELQTAAVWAALRADLAAGRRTPAAAVPELEDCILRADRLHLTLIVTAATAAAAGLLAAQGRGAQAAALLDLAARHEPQADWLIALRCSLLYYADKLDALERLLQQQPLPTQINDATVTIGVHHALLAAARGDFPTAVNVIARLKIAALPAAPLIREGLAAIEAELQLRAGQPQLAADWLQQRPELFQPAAAPPFEKLQLSAVRVCLAHGRLAEAERLLTLLQATSEQLALPHRSITLLLLRARLLQLRGAAQPALIESAIQLAQSCQLPRLLLDEMPELRARLQTAPAGASATETLSVRDRRLLRLLMQGCSNRQIAERLHLSEGSVKQYFVALYARLGVANRTAAAAAARRLGLSDEMT